MMYSFGKISTERLKTIHPIGQLILNDAIKVVDFSIICGLRNEQDQDEAFRNNKSTKQFPDSRHNKTNDPQFELIKHDISDAWDIAPWPTLYSNEKYILIVAGVIKACAERYSVKLRWGGDWNGNGKLNDSNSDLYLSLIHI